MRHFLDDEQDSSENVNVGRLPEESRQGFTDWIGAMSWIEEDDAKRDRPNEGWLWIHQSPLGS